MYATRAICALTGASALMLMSVSTVQTQTTQHAGHPGSANSGRLNGPLPEPAAVASGLIRHPFAGRNSCR